MQVLRAHVVDLRAVADHDLDDAVQVAGRSVGVLLDDRDLRVRLRDDEHAERGARALLRDREREVQRQLERHAGRHVHERAALEAGRVLGREAVGRADERSEVLQDDGVAAIGRGLERVEHHALGRDELDDRVADLVQLARRLEASEQRRSGAPSRGSATAR